MVAFVREGQYPPLCGHLVFFRAASKRAKIRPLQDSSRLDYPVTLGHPVRLQMGCGSVFEDLYCNDKSYCLGN